MGPSDCWVAVLVTGSHPKKTSLLASTWPIFAACCTWSGNRPTGIIYVTARQARQQYLRLGSFMWHVFAHSLRPQGLAPQMFAPLSCLLTRRFTRPCILLLCAYLFIQMFFEWFGQQLPMGGAVPNMRLRATAFQLIQEGEFPWPRRRRTSKRPSVALL